MSPLAGFELLIFLVGMVVATQYARPPLGRWWSCLRWKMTDRRKRIHIPDPCKGYRL